MLVPEARVRGYAEVLLRAAAEGGGAAEGKEGRHLTIKVLPGAHCQGLAAAPDEYEAALKELVAQAGLGLGA